jgi:hypothetical protein
LHSVAGLTHRTRSRYAETLFVKSHSERVLTALHDHGRLQIRGADELGHERCPWVVVNIPGRAPLFNPPSVHDGDPIRHCQSLGLIVRHVQERHIEALLQGAQLPAHAFAQISVEVAQRLVKQQHLGAYHQGTRQRHPLLLTSRKLLWPALD